MNCATGCLRDEGSQDDAGRELNPADSESRYRTRILLSILNCETKSTVSAATGGSSRLYRGGWPQGEMGWTVGLLIIQSVVSDTGPPNHGLITG